MSPMHKLWFDFPLMEKTMAMIAREFEPIGPIHVPDPNDSLTCVEEADFALVGSFFPGREQKIYDRAKLLKAVIRSGIGYDNVDIDLAAKNGVCALNTPDAPTEATAELTITLLLGLARPILRGNRKLLSGEWPRPKRGFELAGKTLGLVGLGRIGTRVAELANTFRMRVIFYDPFVDSCRAEALDVERVERLEQLYKESDFVSLHLPLSPETRGLVNRETFAQMQDGAYLVNVSRGPIVNETDLYQALKDGQIAGAGLDVWDPEPPAPDNPLFALENVFATPHMGGQSIEMHLRAITTAIDDIRRILRGERPANLLNPEVWDHRR